MNHPVATYSQLRHLADAESCVVCIPSLVSVVLGAEKREGRPLTEKEVLAIRDASLAIHMPTTAAIAIDKRRGYSDIDPENPWLQWLEAREQFLSDEKEEMPNLEGCVRPERSGAVNTTIVEQAPPAPRLRRAGRDEPETKGQSAKAARPDIGQDRVGSRRRGARRVLI